ncbi:MAG: hypothetical protein IKX00_04535 [Bacilli bacterium]|nr:hypothetical protein [Bacilli bacterium]
MKEIISYLYNINVYKEFYFNKQLILKTRNTNYLYQEITEPKKVLYIYNLIQSVNSYKFFCYKFERNIFNEVISKYNDITFVIIDIKNDYKETIDLDDMLSLYVDSQKILFNRINYNNNWDLLWENKINYLTNHFNNNKLLNKNYELVFNYYISIAEISLEYLLFSKKKYKPNNIASFVHRRIKIPNIKLDFFNPLNFIIDLEIRDISEYIKILYYKNDDYETELDYYLKTHHLDMYLASLLYARIIYPSCFFDDYESKNIDINKFVDFISYEKFIKKIYDLISSYIPIDKINF